MLVTMTINKGFNKLKELDLTRAYPLDSLTQIYASNNEIKQIKYIPPINLKKFHLDRNPDPLRFVPSFRW
jgi:Leucine-rich repeat (LRR) protein